MKNIYILAILTILVSCQQSKKASNTANDKKTEATDSVVQQQGFVKQQEVIDSALQRIIGSYVGDFGNDKINSNKITLIVSGLKKDSVSGRSIVGGNDRPFKGIFRLEKGVYFVKANEPGDDKYDGVFDFSFDPAKPDVVTGSWTPNQKEQKSKQFTLKKRAFVYMKDVGSFPMASTRVLKEEDVENMSSYDLTMMRNEIFARHGYCFKEKNMRRVFEINDWYVPNTVSVLKDLTDIEKKNIKLIKRYEKYQEDEGDSYGR